MPKLRELLNENEIVFINKNQYVVVDLDKDFNNITIQELSNIALLLIGSKYGNHIVPKYVLSAEAINILTDRAIERNISLT